VDKERINLPNIASINNAGKVKSRPNVRLNS